MSLDEAMQIVGASVLTLADRVAADRAAADGLIARAEEIYAGGGSIAAEFLRQRADEYLRTAARRETRAQATQMVMDAARTAAKKET